jgi:nicotinamidase-related amidase
MTPLKATASVRALLVIDVQRACQMVEPACLDLNDTVARINALAQAIRPTGLVVFIQQTDESGELSWGGPAWQLLEALDCQPEDEVVEKTACDSFLETGLDRLLKERGVGEVVIVGWATDFCVDTTVRSAAARGYGVTVPSDGHTTRNRAHLRAEQIMAHHNYLWAELLLPRQRKIKILTTEVLLAEIG